MKSYYRVMLGKTSIFASECHQGNYIGVDFLETINLDGKLCDNWRDFNKEFIPVWMLENPGKSKIAAGLSCGALWTVAKGINVGDIVLCPNGNGSYFVGEVLDEYSFHPEGILRHRRTVKWFDNTVDRAEMTEALRKSSGSIGTVSNISRYAEELEKLIKRVPATTIICSDDTVEDPLVFALEKHLEDFLVKNWNSTDLGKDFDIYAEEGVLIGQQFPSDTGPIDILAVSKDKNTLLVVELKRGKASDVVVGQILRYMGYVKDELAEANQNVEGVIIALEDDIRIKRAISATNNIKFYYYQVSFKLIKV